MTLNPESGEGCDPKDARFLEVIDECGWQVLSAAASFGEERALFSYARGLFLRLRQPEMIECGFDSTTSGPPLFTPADRNGSTKGRVSRLAMSLAL